MSSLRRVCVFCGSRFGRNAAYAEGARALGTLMAARGIGLVYGGASVGLMGAVADAVLEAGGEAIGVIPEQLVAREIAHRSLTQQHVVSGMHPRKAMMADLSDAFIALPGGFGTFEELFEVTTWGMLAIHHKPIGLLDTAGFHAPLLAMVDHAVREGFVEKVHAELLVARPDPASLLDELARRAKLTAPPDPSAPPR